MSAKIHAVSLVAITTLIVACGDADITVDGDLAFTNVAVVSMVSDDVLTDQTVVVRDREIIHIGPSDSTRLSNATEVINAQGKYLAPGLADMHVHMMSDVQSEMTVTYGVTTVRNMWGYTEETTPGLAETLTLRTAIEEGRALGPRIITAGQLIDGTPKIWQQSKEVETAEQAIQAVQEQLQQPFDFIKVYSHLSQEAFAAIAGESRRSGRPFAGHVPDEVPMRDALNAGMKSMEHMIGFDTETVIDKVAFGARRSDKRNEIAARIGRGEEEAGRLFDEDAMRVLAQDVAASGTWIVPTLIVLQNIVQSDAEIESQFARDDMKYVAPMMRDFWNPQNDFRRKALTPEMVEGLKRLSKLNLARVKILHDSGARLLAGSDVPNPFVFDGLSLHEEMALFVEAGLSPYEAIRTATVAPAEFFGEAGSWGQVSTGAKADLVLLNGDPLVDIQNYLEIAGVMIAGRWVDSTEIESIRNTVARKYSAMPAQLTEY